MAGSKEAKRAWFNLRGPYLLAYIAYLSFSVMAPPGEPANGGIWWSWVATIMGTFLVFGSISSWMVVSHYEPQGFWRKAELLEVTALRVIFVFEIVFGVWGLLKPDFPNYVAILHVLMGLLFAGVLSNMTWHKVRVVQNAPVSR